MDKPQKKTFRLTEPGILATQISSPHSGECPYTLFLGAGASLSSGIPSVNELIEEWSQEAYCHINDLPTPLHENHQKGFEKWKKANDGFKFWIEDLKEYLGSNSTYGTLFQHTRKTREERQMYIERLVGEKRPGPGYIYLAALIAAKKINRILTTNFDDLLNDALVRYYDIKPINCAFDSAVNSFNNSSLRPKIIKLHGDFLYDNVRNTDDELTDLSENMEAKLVEMCEDKGLVVIGYNGEDESIMNPIRENLRKNKKFLTKGLHWCIHTGNNEKRIQREIPEDQIPASLRAIRKRHPDKVFLYSISGFDRIMESTFIRAQLKLPPAVLNPYENNVANEFYRACEKLAIGSRLTPTIRRHMVEALKHMETTPDKKEIKLRRANQVWGDGAHLRDNESDFTSAAKNFNDAIAIVNELLASEGLTKAQRFKATKRKIGCLIGLAKVSIATRKSPNSFLDDAHECASPLLTTSYEKLNETELEELLSVQFNTLCSLGLRVESTKTPPKEVIDAVVKISRKMRSNTLGRIKLNKLKDEPEIQSILDLINNEQDEDPNPN
ncbi:MAG: SIR2 family protein [Gammaproteobacteria bacterium]